jgi:hypothetical protein
MVQALSSSTAFAYRYQHQPPLLNSEGKYYPCYKPIPIKRAVLRKIKFNENCVDPYHSTQLPHQRKSKKALTQAYQCIRQQNCVQQRPELSNVRKSEVSMNQSGNNRHVRFNNTMDVYELPDRTSEDRYRSWYNKNDYVRFGNERKNTVHVIQQFIQSYQLNSDTDIDEYLDPNEHTVLGVEQYIYGKEQIFCRKLHMLRHIRSVLQQQQQQHQQQQYQRRQTGQHYHDAELYLYPETYDIDVSKYHHAYYQHQATSHPCATTMHQPIHYANPIHHTLHVW